MALSIARRWIGGDVSLGSLDDRSVAGLLSKINKTPCTPPLLDPFHVSRLMGSFWFMCALTALKIPDHDTNDSSFSSRFFYTFLLRAVTSLRCALPILAFHGSIYSPVASVHCIANTPSLISSSDPSLLASQVSHPKHGITNGHCRGSSIVS